MRPGSKLPQSSLWLKLVGWACVAVGLLGLLLPILPGIPLLVAGLVTLSSQHRWARALLVRVKRRYRGIYPRKKSRTKSKSGSDKTG
ncbi:MAG TPA: PGPGW domain-containing protein [Terracidiphilus sp.]|nr:PGPGW domain-containing protein [Terracidiphilus sp.]